MLKNASALECFHRVITITDDKASDLTYHGMAECLIREGKINAAINFYRKAVKANKYCTQAYINCGIAFLRIK